MLPLCSTPSVIAYGDATFPKGTAFGGGGKVSGIAIRRPLGGAGALAPEGVTSPPRLRGKNRVENHSLCPFSTPGFSPRRFVENCPG